ncbi:hypothetical protein [Halorarius litoreus]|uniref:hypothetical protein n=1 Tax=Halorarius litoreus TaxID=2962676 RepID=UPI0020CF9D43|nr:hypothetical protein [Halorarius litoreus]
MSGIDIDAQLLAGEQRRDELLVDAVRLVRTSHRLLVVQPDADPRFRAVELPNVRGVGRATDAPGWALSWAVQALVVGVVFAAGGLFVPVDTLGADVTAPQGTGLDSTLQTAQQLFALAALLDEALLVLGAVCVVAGVALAGWYLVERERRVVVEVSGGDPVLLPGDAETVERVRAFLAEA